MENQMLFGHNIDHYFDEMLADLERLIAIPSVCDTNSAEGPYGQNCKDALDCILEIAGRLGLNTENVDYYAGEASLGDKGPFVDVLTHVDVVPAGNDWDSEPYAMIQKGTRLYGRGTADDKGCAIAALYSLKALKDAGVEGTHRLRSVFGCGEEIASDDLEVYYSRRGFPVMGFTPDCSYGICNSEKGILRLDLLAPHTDDTGGGIIIKFSSGNAVNSVPSQAYVKIKCTLEQYANVLKHINTRTDFKMQKEVISPNNYILEITALGKAAHGAEPELGENAACKLIQLLYHNFTPEELGPLITFSAQKIQMEHDGTSLGIQMSDDESGVLTLNVGIVSCQDSIDVSSLDIRYPVTANKEELLARLKHAANNFGIQCNEVHHMAPLHVPSDSILVSTLSKAYKCVTGEHCNIYSTGGGTYARHANNAVVAFGPIFPGELPSNAHGPNESIDIEHYKLHCRICLEALYRLFIS